MLNIGKEAVLQTSDQQLFQAVVAELKKDNISYSINTDDVNNRFNADVFSYSKNNKIVNTLYVKKSDTDRVKAIIHNKRTAD